MQIIRKETIKMGLFSTKKIKLDKVENKNNNIYFIDYYKLTKSEAFIKEFIYDLTDNKRLLLLIDTDSFYLNNRKGIEQTIIDLKKELKQREIIYDEIVSQKDEDVKLLGLKMVQSSKKVNVYKLGLVANSNQVKDIVDVIKKYNAFIYITMNETDQEQLLNHFKALRGDHEQLDNEFDLSIFYDSQLKRIRINSKEAMGQYIEEKLRQYQ